MSDEEKMKMSHDNNYYSSNTEDYKDYKDYIIDTRRERETNKHKKCKSAVNGEEAKPWTKKQPKPAAHTRESGKERTARK